MNDPRWKHLPAEDRPDKPAPEQASPWAGVTLFTAWDPLAAFQFEGLADRVAIRPDLIQPSDLLALRAAFPLVVWEAQAAQGQHAVDWYGAVGYIAQTEGPSQHDAATSLPPPRAPSACVGTPDYLVPGWLFMFECYQQAVPAPGYFSVPWLPVVGVFDRYPLAAYADTLAAHHDFAIYLAEGCTDDDIATLRTLKGQL